MSHKDQVRRFYSVLWDAHDKSAISSVLHEEVTFRGSLGHEKKGHGGFAEYVDMVHEALAEYRCVIEDLVAEDNKVFAKMLFKGIHRNNFMGYAPTQKRLEWRGCALFTFKGNFIINIWVLGDLKNLEAQLRQNAK